MTSFDWNWALGGAGVAYGIGMKPLYIALVALGAAWAGEQMTASAANKKQMDYAALGLGLGGAAGRMIASFSMNERYLAMAGGGVGGYWLAAPKTS